MRRVRFFWVAGVSVLAAALAWVDSRAAVDDATNAAINKVADLIEKGDKDGAEKAAKQVAKDAAGDVETVMSAFKLRSKKGIGVGTKPGVSVPDAKRPILVASSTVWFWEALSGTAHVTSPPWATATGVGEKPPLVTITGQSVTCMPSCSWMPTVQT